MCGGIALTLDAARADRRLPAAARRPGARPDDPRAHRRPAGRPAGRGVRRAAGGGAAAAPARSRSRAWLAGVGAGVLEGYVMSRPYLHYVRGSLDPAALHRRRRGDGLRRGRHPRTPLGLPDLTRVPAARPRGAGDVRGDDVLRGAAGLPDRPAGAAQPRRRRATPPSSAPCSTRCGCPTTDPASTPS